MAAVTTLNHEVKTVETSHGNVERERDKLKSDLQVQKIMEKHISTFLLKRLRMSVPLPLQLRLMNNMLYRNI